MIGQHKYVFLLLIIFGVINYTNSSKLNKVKQLARYKENDGLNKINLMQKVESTWFWDDWFRTIDGAITNTFNEAKKGTGILDGAITNTYRQVEGAQSFLASAITASTSTLNTAVTNTLSQVSTVDFAVSNTIKRIDAMQTTILNDPAFKVLNDIKQGVADVLKFLHDFEGALAGTCLAKSKFVSFNARILKYGITLTPQVVCVIQTLESVFKIVIIPDDTEPRFKEVYDDDEILVLNGVAMGLDGGATIILGVLSALDDASSFKLQVGLAAVAVALTGASTGLKGHAFVLQSQPRFFLSMFQMNGQSMYSLAGDLSSSALPKIHMREMIKSALALSQETAQKLVDSTSLLTVFDKSGTVLS